MGWEAKLRKKGGAMKFVYAVIVPADIVSVNVEDKEVKIPGVESRDRISDAINDYLEENGVGELTRTFYDFANNHGIIVCVVNSRPALKDLRAFVKSLNPPIGTKDQWDLIEDQPRPVSNNILGMRH